LLLKFGLTQARAQKAVLIQQNILVESDIGDTDDFLVAQLRVVAMDRHLVKRIVPVSVQAAVAVVITNRVCSAEICDPARLEQRNQPGQMLAGHRHWSGNGKRKRVTFSDGLIENGIDTPQVSAAESGQAAEKKLVERFALIDATRPQRLPPIPFISLDRRARMFRDRHLFDHSRSGGK